MCTVASHLLLLFIEKQRCVDACPCCFHSCSQLSPYLREEAHKVLFIKTLKQMCESIYISFCRYYVSDISNAFPMVPVIYANNNHDKFCYLYMSDS
jgi:hypothetical protein